MQPWPNGGGGVSAEEIARLAELLIRYHAEQQTSGGDTITQDHTNPDIPETVR
jgi:hypothetical protein